MTKFADDASTEAARKAVAEDKKVVDRSRAEYGERMKGKPTPTQEENDLAAHGAHILEHDPDGSDPDVNVLGSTSRSLEAERPARPQSYQTRATTAAKTE